MNKTKVEKEIITIQHGLKSHPSTESCEECDRMRKEFVTEFINPRASLIDLAIGIMKGEDVRAKAFKALKLHDVIKGNKLKDSEIRAYYANKKELDEVFLS